MDISLLITFCGACLCPFIVYAPYAYGMGKVFEKAGRPAWEGWVPVYNWYILTIEVAKKDIVMFLIILLFSPVGLTLVGMEVARRFGKEQLYGVGLGLLGPIFFLLLGMDKEARYDSSPAAAGGGGGGGYNRPRRDRDDD